MNTVPMRQALKINALFTAISSLVLLVFSEGLARFMGRYPALVNEILGVGLLVLAADVLWIATRKTLSLALARGVFYFDVAYVLATPLVMIVFRDYLSAWGQVLLVDVAIGVLLLAYFEGRGVRTMLASAKA